MPPFFVAVSRNASGIGIGSRFLSKSYEIVRQINQPGQLVLGEHNEGR